MDKSTDGIQSGEEDYCRYEQEWQKCRETADQFDKILVDLRKYGFTILTGLTTAGSFLGLSPNKPIQIGVIVVTMALILVLYWLDTYYQSLLFGASFRARFLEIFRLNRGLSLYISAFYGASHTGNILHFLYVGFLVGLFILGLFAAGILGQTPLNGGSMNTLWVLLGGELSAFAGIVGIYALCDRPRTKTVKDVSQMIKDKWDKRRDPDVVGKLDQDIMNHFKKYL